MRTLFSAALLASTFSVPVLAQTPDSFSGPRVEAIAGWDRVQSASPHQDGITYGGGVGYDVRSGSAVLGVDGEVTGSTTNDCRGAGTVASPSLCTKAGRDLYAGGRVGTVVGHDTMLYAKAGYSNARVRLTSNNGTETTPLLDRDLDGVRVGAGVEHKFGTYTYAKAEYRYSNYQAGVTRHQVLAGVGVRF